MTRPFMQHGIADLEAMFSQSNTDLRVLKDLKSELEHRKVPRATMLLGQVVKAIQDMAPGVNSGPARIPAKDRVAAATGDWPIPRFLPLRAEPEIEESVGATSVLPETNSAQPLVTALTLPPIQTPLTAQAARQSEPGMVASVALEEAYKLLKVTPTTVWESIENVRRSLVLQAHPAKLSSLSEANRERAIEAARRVNLAYAVVARARSAQK